MLVPTHLRDLHLAADEHPRGQPHLSAASGLVRVGRQLYVVADDEHHLGVLALEGDPREPVRLQRLRAGDLPHDPVQRKRRKPDLEALMALPATDAWPHGALLALGSGSRSTRNGGWLFALNAQGGLRSAPVTIDLAPLYAPLRLRFADLNIEGAFLAGGCLHLLQRGNQAHPVQACIDYEPQEVLGWLATGSAPPPQPLQVSEFALGAIDGVALGFTDGAELPDGGWVFSAVAEDTRDSYADGRCAGSAIGWVAADGDLLRIEEIRGAPKVEGIAVRPDGGLLLVTDADDPGRASQLLAA